jgi:ubiquitin carboxyl-terminal hydrolase 10
MNVGNMRFANAVLQLLMHSPPFWNLFNELGELKRQRGAGGPEIGGGMTPLVDATVRFFEDYTFKEKELPSTQLPQRVAGENLKGDGEEGKFDKVVDSFEWTYMYDAMKDKRQLKDLLVRSRTMYRPDVTDIMCIGWPTAGCGSVFPALPRRA